MKLEKTIKKCTKESRLQLLHWIILHDIYPTSILLHKIGICSSNKCLFCGEVDYLELFFPGTAKRFIQHGFNAQTI